MTERRRALVSTAAAIAWLGATTVACAEVESALAPYQMVRSLQLVQDRIAAGDHAAIPMQRKLLQMIDDRFKDTESEDYNDLRNFRAMLVYAMSGGNPKTIETALTRIHLDETNRTLGIGILNYLRGNYKSAKAVLDDVEPLKIEPELGAFFALVKGSVNAIEDPKGAFELFDQARLLAPGTLIEEAALRRTISLAATSAESARFLSTSEQYVRRFLTSPYASQFADAFVTGVIDLHGDMDRTLLADVISRMEPAQRKTIYLRLARRSAIEGHGDLAAFASAGAEAIDVPGFGPDGDPRAELYSSLASVTSDTVDATLVRLKKIDRKLLSEGDRQLLDAAEAMAAEVTNVPLPVVEEPKPVEYVKPAADGDIDEADLIPEGEAAKPAEADPATRRVAASADAHAEPAIEGERHPATAAPQAAVMKDADPAATMVIDTRRKLEEIDKLLGETAQ